MDFTQGDWLNFQARACSLPPLPMSKMVSSSIAGLSCRMDHICSKRNAEAGNHAL